MTARCKSQQLGRLFAAVAGVRINTIMIRMFVTRLALLAIILLSGGVTTYGEEKPLTLRDVARMKHDGLSLDKIVEKAAERGVEFEVTPGAAKQLARIGFQADQIDALKQSHGTKKAGAKKAAEKSGAKAEGKVEPIVPGQGLKTTDAQRDAAQEQVARITKLSGANVQPITSQHVTLWAEKKDQANYLPDIKRLEKFLESKCQEPLRSGLDKRSAHIILLKSRYDYERWIRAMFDEMPDTFKMPDTPGGEADLKAAILKWTGYYSHNFIAICMESEDVEWLHRMTAAGFGYMNLVQQIEPRHQDPLATGFANGMESVLMGSPSIMLFSSSYHNENRELGNDARAWLNLVKDRIRTKKVSGVRQLFTMNTTNMVLPHYAEAWTLVGVLMKQPEKFGKLLLELREEKVALKAIETVYGWDEKKLEEQWYKDVLKW